MNRTGIRDRDADRDTGYRDTGIWDRDTGPRHGTGEGFGETDCVTVQPAVSAVSARLPGSRPW